MKKIKVVAMFVLTGLILTSCGSDDSGPTTPATINAKWNRTRTVSQVTGGSPVSTPYNDNVTGCTKNYIEFATPNVYNDVVYFSQGGTCSSNTNAGTWTKSDDVLTIVNGGNLSGRYDIKKLTSTELNIESETTAAGVTTTTTVYFTKAAQ